MENYNFKSLSSLLLLCCLIQGFTAAAVEQWKCQGDLKVYGAGLKADKSDPLPGVFTIEKSQYSRMDIYLGKEKFLEVFPWNGIHAESLIKNSKIRFTMSKSDDQYIKIEITAPKKDQNKKLNCRFEIN